MVDRPAGSAASLPSGTVTFLMTDIVGSSLLYEHDEVGARRAVERHNVLLTEGIEGRGGAVIRPRNEGDSIFAVFPRAGDAVTAAVEIQQALAREPWPAGLEVRVRMALYTGEAELRDGDYFGAAVNRCARMRDAAHGGQVLICAATAELSRAALPAGAELRDLGDHRFRNIAQPLRVLQIIHPGLPSELPPIRSLAAFATNLPSQLTSFVGRRRELHEVKQRLEESRLVSLIGAGGAGKTRLALQAASQLLEAFGDGVWLVELAATGDPGLVPRAVAAALGLREGSDRDPTDLLIEHLQGRAPLLVLDNCEHLVQACAELSDALLRACPRLRILATSREPLGVAGEVALRVPSLALPELTGAQAGGHGGPFPGPGGFPSAAALREYESVQLFLDRALAVQPRFPVTDQAAQTVAQVCQRLDGIPLALELAAARVKVLTIEQIAVRLDDRFHLLTGGARTALPRQQTLRATIDWSYELLAEAERAVLRCLSVFVGGWTLEAAEAICPDEEIEAYEVLDLLALLVDKSLVLVAESSEDEARYRLLETVRQYARERLDAAGEAATLQGRHLGWLVDLAERAEPELRGPHLVTWMDRLEREHDNVRAALAWSLPRPEHAEETLRLVGALYRFWQVRHLSEGYAWLRQALDVVAGLGPDQQDVVRAHHARALTGAGVLVRDLGDNATARRLFEESLAMRRVLGDRWGIGQALNNLTHMLLTQREYEAADALARESVEIWRELGDPWGLSRALSGLAQLSYVRGEVGPAAEMLTEALALARGLHDLQGLGWMLYQFGQLEAAAGQDADAEAHFQECEAVQREIGDQHGLARVLGDLGLLALRRGEHEPAGRLLRESAAIFRALGNPNDVGQALRRLAALDAASGQPARAALLLGAAATDEAAGATFVSAVQVDLPAVEAWVRAALGEPELASHRAQGASMGRDRALALALGEAAPG